MLEQVFPASRPAVAPVDNKKHEYVISDAVYGSEDVDHIIIKIDAFENGMWKTKGTAVEYARGHQLDFRRLPGSRPRGVVMPQVGRLGSGFSDLLA